MFKRSAQCAGAIQQVWPTNDIELDNEHLDKYELIVGTSRHDRNLQITNHGSKDVDRFRHRGISQLSAADLRSAGDRSAASDMQVLSSLKGKPAWAFRHANRSGMFPVLLSQG